MKTRPLTTKLSRALTNTVATLPLIFAAQAQAAPTVTITHPAGTLLPNGSKTTTDISRTVDCATIKTIGAKRYITPDFAQQVDVNGQILYVNTVPQTTDIPTLQNYWGGVTAAAIKHAQQFHGQCNTQKDCPVLSAYKACLDHPAFQK